MHRQARTNHGATERTEALEGREPQMNTDGHG
jgi:hypothetical protein